MSPTRKTSRRVPGIVLGVSLLLGIVAVWVIYSAPRSQAARNRQELLANARQDVSAGPAAVARAHDVLRATRTLEPEIVERSGVLEPIRAVQVAAEVAGRILEIPAREHQPIEAGALLVRLDAALAEAAALRAKARHQLAASELRRQRALRERGIGSRAELDRVRAEERAAYAARLEAGTRLERTLIRAPFAGVVNSLELDPGAYVVPGTPIAEILDTATLELEIGVSDLQVASLEAGQRPRVFVDSRGADPIEGRIDRIGRASDEQTRRFPVVVSIDNPDGHLLPGMLATVEFELALRPSIRVPRRAVEREFELDYLFVVEEQDGSDRASRRRVITRPVPFRPEQVEITSGLEEGDRVVISGVGALHDGVPVLARNPAGTAAP